MRLRLHRAFGGSKLRPLHASRLRIWMCQSKVANEIECLDSSGRWLDMWPQINYCELLEILSQASTGLKSQHLVNGLRPLAWNQIWSGV